MTTPEPTTADAGTEHEVLCHRCGSSNLEADTVPPGPQCPETGYSEDWADAYRCRDCRYTWIEEAA